MTRNWDKDRGGKGVRGGEDSVAKAPGTGGRCTKELSVAGAWAGAGGGPILQGLAGKARMWAPSDSTGKPAAGFEQGL